MNVAGASGKTNSDKRRTKENQSLSPAAEAKVHKKVRENTKKSPPTVEFKDKKWIKSAEDKPQDVPVSFIITSIMGSSN